MLRTLIARSGLSARKFATRVLYRNERTVRRWLAGDPMPAEVAAFIHTQSLGDAPALAAARRVK